MAAGRSNRQIAADLHVSVTTIDKHIGMIKSRWNVRSRAGIAWLASRGAASR